MKVRTVITLLTAVFVTACAESASSLTPTDGKQTIAVTEDVLRQGISDTIRFGKIHSGEIAVREFVLRNETDAPMIIIRHETSCHCTSFEYGKRPVVKGGETTVKCSFDSRGEYGWQFKLVKLRLAGADEPLRIFVEADVTR